MEMKLAKIFDKYSDIPDETAENLIQDILNLFDEFQEEKRIQDGKIQEILNDI